MGKGRLKIASRRKEKRRYQKDHGNILQEQEDIE
jgi:hypothetical protein